MTEHVSGARSVLVVDDDEDIRDTIAEVLRDAGYAVRVAADGGRALVDMRDYAPCVVLLDLMMPLVDGWQVVEEMRRDPELADIPVCIVSAQAALAPAATVAVLSKPVSLQGLLGVVRAHCECAAPVA